LAKLLNTFFVIIFIALAITALIAGAVIMYLNSGNDFEGYALSENYTIDTSANAFVLWVGSPVSESRLKWVITPMDSNKEIFAGWGAAGTVNAYTGQYKYATPESGWSYIARAYDASIKISSLHIINQNSPVLPPSQDEPIWLDKVTTSDSITLYCTPNNDGDKMGMLVIMNTDGSNGVNATIQLGSRIAIYAWLPNLLIPIGIVLLIVGLILIKRKK